MTIERCRNSNNIPLTASPSVTNSWLLMRHLKAQPAHIESGRFSLCLKSYNRAWLQIQLTLGQNNVFQIHLSSLQHLTATSPNRGYNYKINNWTNLKEMNIGYFLEFPLSNMLNYAHSDLSVSSHSVDRCMIGEWQRWPVGSRSEASSPLYAHQNTLMCFWVQTGD